MADQGEQLKPVPDNPKPLVEWSDQEVDKFVEAFSLDDFELVKLKEGDEEGYVKVRIPYTVEPMAKGLIASEWKIVEAFDAPLEKESQEKMSHFIGRAANITGASEAQEADWIQKFGEFTEVADMMAGRPDPALEEMKSGVRREAHKMVTSSFKILLRLAASLSWDSFIQEQREKYQTPENLPKDAEETILAKDEDYQQIKGLINRDPQTDQTPRFVIANSAGREIFRSTPALNVS